jgi:two-component system chemotaxis sensor kinase CheA
MVLETNQYLSMFIDESKDHLQALNENLLKLENSPNNINIVQDIFRSAHTLKGMSATMGFEDIAALTHEMENVLDLLRNQKLKMNSFIFDSLFKSLDSLEAMVEDVIAGGTGKADVSEIVDTLKASISGDHKSASAAKQKSAESNIELDQYQYSILQQSIESGFTVFYIEVTVRDSCVLKAARAYMVFDQLEQHGEVVKSSPSVQDIEQEKFDKKFTMYFISNLDQASLETMILNVSEIDTVQTVLIDAEELKHLNPDSLHNNASTQKSEDEESGSNTDTAAAVPKQTASAVANRTIRVDIDRLDTLMNLFSELLIDRVRLESLAEEIKRSELTDTVEHMSRVSSDLQNIVLKLRMVPVESVFNRFPRMVRDLAKTLDKKIDLVITGADTELDRTVIDEIGDPLVHLIRNALDHGIEPVKDRIVAGKPETGIIHLRAYHSGNHVFIEIEEDGRGIDRDKVLKTAIKNGVIQKDEAMKMSDEDVYQLLFASGFSTADKISDVSGRGVGLDVVKSKINSLGGQVTIESSLGKGTKFSVQLPLTLSIITAMLIRIGEEKYAIPLSSIVETSIIQMDQIRKVHGTEMIDYRNNLIPILSLKKVFECPVDDTQKLTETDIVVTRKGDKLAAFMVDEFIGQQEIVLKALGKYLSNVFAVSGATILGDGQVALIIDPNALLK